ncbi:NAD-dependent epimerase/dehydratase family protein [Actinopolymorpha sp. B11F2]|uniref:NAD-dependent epimerase/dehydratase family protein n=1 Tax=Actinopolymorpha sp. B11F2 TaxID=3160862 RepID=UPI0032E3D265
MEGRQRARSDQPSQLVIHDAEGKIEDESTYQYDAFPCVVSTSQSPCHGTPLWCWSPSRPLVPGPSLKRSGADVSGRAVGRDWVILVRVVVTGASGSVGTALLRSVPAHDWSILAVARRIPSWRRPPYDRARWLSCDVGDSAAISVLARTFTGAAAVVHLAWAISPRSDDPPRSRTNIGGTRHVLQAIERAGVPHLIFASSVAAYAPPPRWALVDEGAPLGGIPSSAYSRDKATVESMLDDFERRCPSTRVARIRPCAVVQHDAGAQLASWTMSPLIPSQVIGQRWLPVPLWRGLRAQIIHAEDVASALWSIVQTGAEGAFNLASSPVLSRSDLGRILGGFALPLPRRLLSALAWPTWRIGLQPSHPGWLAMADQAALVTTERARAELRWSPQHSADAALADCAAGIRATAHPPSPALQPEHPSDIYGRLRALHLGSPMRQRA